MKYFTSETLEAFLIKDPNKITLSEKEVLLQWQNISIWWQIHKAILMISFSVILSGMKARDKGNNYELQQ